MNVLHICSGFAKQKIYDELVTSLEHAGVESQFVYAPVRSAQEIDCNRNTGLVHTKYRYAYIIRRYHRIFFRRKIETVYSDLISSTDIKQFSAAHAHFLFSDGAPALMLKEAHGLEYLVAIRNTDLNYFLKYRPDLLGICRRILHQAHAIIFISPTYLPKLLSKMPRQDHESIRQKSHIVPNGVSEFWLNDGAKVANPDRDPVRLLYVGDFSKNKNIPNIICAASLLRKQYDIELTIVGDSGNGAKKVSDLLASGDYPFVTRLGRIDDRNHLRLIYKQHDIFVMPSIHETFGVVYIEAMSQGLPVICSHGQGIDGFFEKCTVVETVDPKNPVDISTKIEKLIGRLPTIRPLCQLSSKQFSWKKIAESYVDLYKDLRASDRQGF